LKLQFAYNEDVVVKSCSLAKPILSQIYSLRMEILSLSKTRDNLLPKLMSGKMNVNEIEAFTV